MEGEPLDVGAFLEARADHILSSASAMVARRHLAHYDAAGSDEIYQRLRTLFDVLVRCCAADRVEPALAYAETLGVDRLRTGHELGEVQNAINVLEESVWSTLIADAPAEALAYALGLVSTVLGAVKDRLACTYVARVSSKRPPTLRLESLFEGTEGAHPG